MKVSRMGFEIPDRCPKECRFLKELQEDGYYQGCMCDYCPVLQCSLIKGEPGNKEGYDEDWYLIPPMDYREDWAYEFSKYFADMKYEPKLSLSFSLMWECIGYLYPVMDRVISDNENFPGFDFKYVEVKKELRSFIGDRFLDSTEYELLIKFICDKLEYQPPKKETL